MSHLLPTPLHKHPPSVSRRFLGFSDSIFHIQYVGINDTDSVKPVRVWKWRRGTKPFIIILSNIWLWVYSFTTTASKHCLELHVFFSAGLQNL